METCVLDSNHPWPGLAPFFENDAAFFHGRDDEAAELFRLVQRDRLTVLFGRSGIGKTSLLHAGLFPLLRRVNVLPVSIRLDFTVAQLDLRGQVLAAIAEAATAADIEAPPGGDVASLWEYFHRAGAEFWTMRNRLVTPLLVFDQFEELFTHGRSDAARSAACDAFIGELGDLVEGRPPAELKARLDSDAAATNQFSFTQHNYKVVFSFREDFLADIETLRRQIPAVSRNRIRLDPMNGKQAFRQVTRAGGALVEPDVARALVLFVAGKTEDEAPRLESVEVEPALLSLVCTELNSKRLQRGDSQVTTKLLEGNRQEILTGFYERSLADMDPAVRRFIEERLLTVSGYRDTEPLDNAVSEPGVTQAAIERLVDRRLLRLDDRGGIRRIELTHDVLTGVVRASRIRRSIAAEEGRKRIRLLRWGGALASAVLAIAVAVAVLNWMRAIELELQLERERSAEIERKADRSYHMEAARAAHARGTSHLLKGEYKAAFKAFEEAKTGYEKLSAGSEAGGAQAAIGRAYALDGDAEQARTAYERALEAGRELRDAELEGQALEGLAVLEDRAGRTAEALELYGQAERAYERAGNVQAGGRVLERSAIHEEGQGAFDRAAGAYERARASYKVVGDQAAVDRMARALVALEQVKPWGFLIDLHTAKVHELRGKEVRIGRDTEGEIVNDISFASQLVSRRHLVISRAGSTVEDQRSTNGTTVSGRFLPYGRRRQIADGDLIVLAGVRALQFRARRPEAVTGIPPNTWGVLLDHGARSYRYLRAAEYTLNIKGKRLLLSDSPSQPGLVRLRKGEILDVQDSWRLIIALANKDAHERILGELYQPLPEGIWLPLSELPSVPLLHARLSGERSITEPGPTFQVLPTEASESSRAR